MGPKTDPKVVSHARLRLFTKDLEECFIVMGVVEGVREKLLKGLDWTAKTDYSLKMV